MDSRGLVDAGRQGRVSSGCGRSSGVPLKISMVTPEVAVRSEVRDPGAAELTAENHAVPAVGLRNSLVEVRSGDGDMLDALALLGEETRGRRRPSASAVLSR
jgi:hypothetical protein